MLSPDHAPWTLSEWGEHTPHSRHWHRPVGLHAVESTEAIRVQVAGDGDLNFPLVAVADCVTVYPKPRHEWRVGMDHGDDATYEERKAIIGRYFRDGTIEEGPLMMFRARLDALLMRAGE